MTQLKVLQVNLGGGRIAQDLVLQTARQMEVDVLVLSHTYRPPENNPRWAVDASKKVAVVATGRYPLQGQWSSDVPGLIAAKVGGITFLSCYAPPSLSREGFAEFVEAIELEAQSHPQVVVAGDFNAWHEEWGSRRSNERGEVLLEASQQLGLLLMNRGNVATFVGNGVATASVVDVTFASSSIAQPSTWLVRNTDTRSDHRYITYSVGPASADQQRNQGQSRQRGQRERFQHAGTRFKTKQFSKENFLATLHGEGFREKAVNHQGMISAMISACEKTMQRMTSSFPDPHRDVYWWTPLIALLRQNCEQTRDRMQQTSDLQNRSLAAAQYRTAKAELDRAIRASKKAAFQELIDAAEENVFGAGYLVVLSRLRGGRAPPETERARLESIVTELFPQHPPFNWPSISSEEEQEQPADQQTPWTQVTIPELRLIASTMPNKKAPGLDGIPNAAVKAAILAYTDVFQALYQSCLETATFPAPWKRQRLVLLPKPGKPPGSSGSYRPLCMLDALGKVLEKLILNRLHNHLEDPAAVRLSDRQHGFRRGRSTIGAIRTVIEAGQSAMRFRRTNGRDNRFLLVVSMDVKNAFNTASWQAIATALQMKGVPAGLQRIVRSYFENRELVFETSDGPVTRSITAGVPQGSILGPTLWNTMYDGVLDVALPQDCEMVAYADDLVLLIPGIDVNAVKAAAEEAVASVSHWMAQHHLQIAPEKTECVLISSTKNPTQVTIRVGDVEVTSSRTMRYLGVTLHDHLSWLPHVREVTTRARKIADAVTRLLRNHSGPKTSKARLLASVAESVIRYAAPIWHGEVTKRECRRLLERVQRVSARRVARTFRTVRYETATLLAGLTPICLLIEEDARVFERVNDPGRSITKAAIRLEERQRTITMWQSQWDAEADTSRYTRWTHRIIRDISAWQGRRHGEMTFHLAQVLSGHGFFREYLAINGFTESPDCRSCAGVPENAHHAIFECPRFARVRMEYFGELGPNPVTPDSLQDFLMGSQDNWSSFCEAARRITTTLQRDWDTEREQRAASNREEAEIQQQLQREEDERRTEERRQLHNEANRAYRQRNRRSQPTPPAPPPTPREAARLEDGRRRVARWRERQRMIRNGGIQMLRALFGHDAWSSESDDEPDDVERGGLDAAQQAAAAEAERAAR